MYLGIRSVLPACSQPALRMPGAPRASLHQNGSIAIRHHAHRNGALIGQPVHILSPLVASTYLLVSMLDVN
jgi:hypothetical protein